MQYAIISEDGQHVRESRNHAIGEGRKGNSSPIVSQRFLARSEKGFGVNRSLAQQKQLRREGAAERLKFRRSLTAEQQVARLDTRPGSSAKERARLAAT